MKSKILKLYTNPKHPGAFSSLNGFLVNNPNLKKDEVLEELFKSKAYTQHVQPKRVFKRRKIIVAGLDVLWQADLIDVQKYKYQNSHYKYIMTVIDCFSRYAWALPIKSNTQEAFKKIIEESGRKPEKLVIDGGNEFKGECKKYLQGLNIKVTIAESDLKAMMVESFNRTLQDKIHRDFTENNNKKYVIDLPDLLNNYNNSIHSSINQKPIDINKKNERATYKYQYGYDIKSGPNDLIEFEFEIGDYVRSVIPKKLFEKGFTIK